MMINGVWHDNITCDHCKFRHPAAITCGEAREAAHAGKLEQVQCKWCGEPTRMTATKMCDGCWELDTRIRSQMELAERILNHYKEDNEQV